jgi:hypothetical protein
MIIKKKTHETTRAKFKAINIYVDRSSRIIYGLGNSGITVASSEIDKNHEWF